VPLAVLPTELATGFACRLEHDYYVVWWVSAERPQEAAARLGALAEQLGLARDVPELDAKVEAVRARLSRHDRWLLVFELRSPA